MQDDILFATFTPREAFKFSADLRLKGLSNEKKNQKVEQVITDLGLSRCCDSPIGGELFKGISGGERKRTSIGVELITNPSIIFLDEPTTGLDSETALNCMLLLKKMSREGRTIISTIHQPSSQIYSSFDQLLLLVQGNLIF
jgi:ABC-type multidrug transport system ATPase subunit